MTEIRGQGAVLAVTSRHLSLASWNVPLAARASPELTRDARDADDGHLQVVLAVGGPSEYALPEILPSFPKSSDSAAHPPAETSRRPNEDAKLVSVVCESVFACRGYDARTSLGDK